jgi:hypothetical protein
MSRFLDILYLAARGSSGRLVFAGKMIVLFLLGLIIFALFLSGLITHRLGLKYTTLTLDAQPLAFVATMIFYVAIDLYLLAVFASVARHIVRSDKPTVQS